MDIDDEFWALVGAPTYVPCITPEKLVSDKKRKAEAASLTDSEGEDENASGFATGGQSLAVPDGSLLGAFSALIEPENTITDYETVVRTNYVNAVFELSRKDGFISDLESFAAFPLGKVCRLLGKKLSVDLMGYHGKCDVNVSGSVQCRGQYDFQEARLLARRLAWDFMKNCGQDVGVHGLKFTVVNLSAQLPWRVNLNKMRRFNNQITFEPQFNEWAIIKYEDLGTTISLSTYGKMRIMCHGDCATADGEMSKAREAVERLGQMTTAYRIKNSVKAIDLPPAEVVESSTPTNVVPKKNFVPEFVPRRSGRLLGAQLAMEDDDDEPDRKMPSWFTKRAGRPVFDLDHSEQSTYHLLKKLAADLVHRNVFVRTLQSVAAAAKTIKNNEKFVDVLKKVAGLFGVEELFPPPVQPIPELAPPKPIFTPLLKKKVITAEKHSRGRPKGSKVSGAAKAAKRGKWDVNQVLEYLDYAVDHDDNLETGMSLIVNNVSKKPSNRRTIKACRKFGATTVLSVSQPKKARLQNINQNLLTPNAHKGKHYALHREMQSQSDCASTSSVV